jgi:hypothetical protein
VEVTDASVVREHARTCAREQRQECLLIAFEKATNYVTLDTLLIMSRRHARASRRARGSSYPALSILVKLGPEEVDRFRRYLKPHCID